MTSHLSVLSYLTRSMTLSLGAELTGSSLIIMISSPGISLPSEGPPVNTNQTGVEWSKLCTTVMPSFSICLVSWLRSLMNAYSLIPDKVNGASKLRAEMVVVWPFFLSILRGISSAPGERVIKQPWVGWVNVLMELTGSLGHCTWCD